MSYAVSSKGTTIWVSHEVKANLDKMKGSMSYNNFLEWITQQQIQVLFDLLSVDGESPRGHVIIFKLGDYTYVCKDGETPQEVKELKAIGTEENETNHV
jgi:predicted CopG family antitoxin